LEPCLIGKALKGGALLVMAAHTGEGINIGEPELAAERWLPHNRGTGIAQSCTMTGFALDTSEIHEVPI